MGWRRAARHRVLHTWLLAQASRLSSHTGVYGHMHSAYRIPITKKRMVRLVSKRTKTFLQWQYLHPQTVKIGLYSSRTHPSASQYEVEMTKDVSSTAGRPLHSSGS